MSKLRLRPLRKPSPALIIATIALVMAMGGTGYAAFKVSTKNLRNGAITTAKLRNGAVTQKKLGRNLTVANALHANSANSAGSATNASHATNADNATNANNATNAGHANSASNASGLSGPLASGQTLKGTFGMGGNGPGFVQEEGITFQIPLASAPTQHYIAPGGASTPQCPGSVSAPSAAPGQLCFYGAVQTNANGLSTVSGFPKTIGTVIFPAGVTANNNYESDGTWAVTAP
jgi:hypothetical protein